MRNRSSVSALTFWLELDPNPRGALCARVGRAERPHVGADRPEDRRMQEVHELELPLSAGPDVAIQALLLHVLDRRPALEIQEYVVAETPGDREAGLAGREQLRA